MGWGRKERKREERKRGMKEKISIMRKKTVSLWSSISLGYQIPGKWMVPSWMVPALEVLD